MRISDWSSDVCSSDLTAPDMVTRLAVGIVVGVALSPLVAGVQGRFGVRRGVAAAVVAGGLVLFFAAVVFVVAPPAVEQASRFSRELPATVEELYSWPRSEEHTSELQVTNAHLVCRILLEKKK